MIEVKFRVDEEFTENDLKLMLTYMDTHMALWDIKSKVRFILKNCDDINRETMEELQSYIHEACQSLPELP